VTAVAVAAPLVGTDGLLVVDPGAIDVHFTVRNNGRIASQKKPLQIVVGQMQEVLVTLPVVEPNSEYSSVAHVPAPISGSFLRDTDTMSAHVAIVGLDSKRDDDALGTAPFHLALPALRIEPIVDSMFLRSDAPIPASITIRNVSQYATLPAATSSWCIYDLGGRCSQDFSATAFGALTLPAIAPLQSIVVDHAVVVPTAATHHNLIDALSLGACVTPGHEFNPITISASACMTVRDVEVKPDIEACAPVTLVPDQPTAGAPVCREPCDIVAFRANVEAGHTYRVELTTGGEDVTLRWRTRYRETPVDGSRAAGFQPTVSGTLYLMTATKFCPADPMHEVVLRDIH
jgi:hypothetical protein